MRTTKQQLKFLFEIWELDRHQLGCLSVSSAFAPQRARRIERQCVARHWIRIARFDHPWGRVMYLTTRGLRLMQRSRRHLVQLSLPMGAAYGMTEKTSNERAPLCRVCGYKHWGREPHVFPKSAPKKKAEKR